MNCSATISLARTAAKGCAAFHPTATSNCHCNGSSVKVLTAPSNGIHTTTTTTQTAATITTMSGKPTANGHSSDAVEPASLPTCKRVEQAAKIVRQSDVVCFDVDSTVIREEGIDELAAFCGKGAEVARVTRDAMGGGMSFQDALTVRLNIIRPTRQQIAAFVEQRPATLTRHVRGFIAQLRAAGKQVYLVSGGFDCLIAPVAGELGVPLATHLYANRLLFDADGAYASFDRTQPTSRSGGKAEAVALIKRQHPGALITMIGDGATDLEAVPPADHFIGFGGNVQRAEVFRRAQYYVSDFAQLMDK